MEEINSKIEPPVASRVSEQEMLFRESVSAAIVASGGIKKMSYATGIPRGTLEKYAAKTSTPSFFNAAVIASYLGISMNDLAGVETPTFGGSVAGEHGSFAFLPFYEEVEAAAGHGAAVIADAAHSVMGFARDLLRQAGASPQHCTVIRARGDSMSPTLPEGALLVVDRSQQEIVANGSIMVVGVENDLLVKRIRRRLDGMIELISDNPAYPPETIGHDMMQQLRVVGRVVYFCRIP